MTISIHNKSTAMCTMCRWTQQHVWLELSTDGSTRLTQQLHFERRAAIIMHENTR